MLPKIIIFILIFHLSSTQDTQSLAVYDANQTSNDLLNDTIPQLNQLTTDTDNLRKKINLLSLSITQHLIKQQNELNRKVNELLFTINNNNRQTTLVTDRTKSQNEFYKSQNPTAAIASNCAEAPAQSGHNEGIQQIQIRNSTLEPFYVYCLTHSENRKVIDDDIFANTSTAWTLILRRFDGSIDFKRNWIDYQHGFGNLAGEFFIGLDKLNALTQSTLHELWIQLEDFDGDKRWAKYSTFAIGNEAEGYPIAVLGSYSGDAGDSLSYSVDQKFSTFDMDNDKSESRNCAADYMGAWWHIECTEALLTGKYYQSSSANDVVDGVRWHLFRGSRYSLKYAHMAIRPIQRT